MIAGGIPEEAIEQHLAILGKTGAGKTYTARLILEWLLEQDRRFCVIDPTGVHYGLRMLADGVTPASSVVIFGGRHGDVPIDSHAGEQLGQIVAEHHLGSVIDVSELRAGEQSRFFTDFADALMRYNHEALHLVIDECHLFMPQGRTASPQSAAMLHQANHLVAGGRARGLRVMLLSQRPAKVHKDSLTQVETLIAMRMIAPQDRNAVKAWISEVADTEAAGADVIPSLPSLPTGTGWVWAPEQEHLQRVAFPRITTYDSMRAARPGEARAELQPVCSEDAAKFALLLKADATARQASNGRAPDVAQHQARIRELEAALAAEQEQSADLRAAVRTLARELRDVIEHVEAAIGGATIPAIMPLRPLPAPKRDVVEVPAVPTVVDSTGTDDLHNDPLVQMAASIWPVRLTWSQLCSLCGRKARGGHFNSVRKRLLDAGVVRMRSSGLVELTDPPDRGGAIPADVLEDVLPEPSRKIFRTIRQHGEAVKLEHVAHELGMAPRGGHWNGGVAMLRQNELIVEHRGRVGVNPVLEVSE